MGTARTAGMEVSVAGRQVGGDVAPEDSKAREAEAGLERLTDWLRGTGWEEEASALTSRTVTGGEPQLPPGPSAVESFERCSSSRPIPFDSPEEP